jgi:hypothetical protein
MQTGEQQRGTNNTGQVALDLLDLSVESRAK